MGFLDAVYEIPGVWKLHATINQFVYRVPPPPILKKVPRKILLVTSHPVPESFSLTIAKTVEETALAEGHEVKRIDLGLEKFQPVLVKEERNAYFDESEKGKLEESLPKDVRSHIQKLKWCDAIFFVYPTWWMNCPANVKGFLDRTMRLHHTWHFPDGKSLLPEGLAPGLLNIRNLYGVSTYGASQAIVTMAGDNGRNCISTAIMPIFSKDCTSRWLGLYNMDFQTDENRKLFLEEVKTMVKEDM